MNESMYINLACVGYEGNITMDEKYKHWAFSESINKEDYVKVIGRIDGRPIIAHCELKDSHGVVNYSGQCYKLPKKSITVKNLNDWLEKVGEPKYYRIFEVRFPEKASHIIMNYVDPSNELYPFIVQIENIKKDFNYIEVV